MDAWKIFAGRRQVAEVPSGLVVGTTRSTINQRLYDEVRKHFKGRIKVCWGHRLKTLDLLERRLVFDVKRAPAEDGLAPTYEEVTLEGGGARVIASDGVWSEVRAYAEKHVEDFESQVTPWGVQFRLLFSKPGATAKGLDPRYHYVLNGIYVSVIEGDVWVLGLGIKDGMDAVTKELLTATEPTPARVAALRAYVSTTAPLAAPFLTEEDLTQFFTRRSFRGAIVKVNHLNLGEWVVFLGGTYCVLVMLVLPFSLVPTHFCSSVLPCHTFPLPSFPPTYPPTRLYKTDAAHSVLPPTGEGFNSGAEDVEVLMEAMREAPQNPFRVYSEMRLPDLHALHELAYDINYATFGPWGPEKVSRLVCTIMMAQGKWWGLWAQTYEDMSFGVDSAPPHSYQEIVGLWRWQRMLCMPLARVCVWPFFIVAWVLCLPFQLLWWLVTLPFRGAAGKGKGKQA